jgi:flavin reductase
MSRPATLREVMRWFPTGVTVLTTGGPDCHGMTANAVSSVSLTPPLVLCCVHRAARMHGAITASRSFAISLLGADQEDLARHFADPGRPAGPAQFEAVAWRPGPVTGAPLLDGALGWLECELCEVHEGGDHSILLARVLAGSRATPGGALVFVGGSYDRVSP